MTTGKREQSASTGRPEYTTKRGSNRGLLLSIILPIRNEEDNLWLAAKDFAEHIGQVVGTDNWQFVMVENGSTDRSPEIIADIKDRWPSTVSISLPNGDYGGALREGILSAEGQWALILNVDHLWDSPFFTWAWHHRDEYQLILGSKRADPTLNQQDNYRRILSAGLNALLQYLFDFVGADSHGMKLLRISQMRPLAEICEMRRGQFDTELTLRALRAGIWVAEAPIPYIEKRKPRNFMAKKILQNLWDLFRIYRVMKVIPYVSTVRYRRVCRDDLLFPTLLSQNKTKRERQSATRRAGQSKP